MPAQAGIQEPKPYKIRWIPDQVRNDKTAIAKERDYGITEDRQK